MNDGHSYIGEAYKKGVRNFIITKVIEKAHFPDANFLIVKDALTALQELATAHRKSFSDLKTIAITGSNGKTIVKEWLYQMLHDQFNIIKSPKSYNSQIGMALSILKIEEGHNLGIFEAGISQSGEMIKHFDMLEPQIGIFTNIGDAHSAGFENEAKKINEKLILFSESESIILSASEETIIQSCEENGLSENIYSWGKSENATIRITAEKIDRKTRTITLNHKERLTEVRIPFIDYISFENVMNCIATMAFLEIDPSEWQARINRVSSLNMRLEMSSGINGTILINDAYSADLDALNLAMEFTNLHAPQRKKIAILSPFDQSGQSEESVLNEISKLSSTWNFDKVYYISESKVAIKSESIIDHSFSTKSAFLESISDLNIHNAAILVKGARRYYFEDIISRLEDKGHTATLSINLNHLEDNLRVYKSMLKKGTGIIAVVKASAYGSGSIEVAQILEKNRIDYLAVAFADEGIALRKAGITTPILVLNPDLNSLPSIIRYDLEPEVYSLNQMQAIKTYCEQANQEIMVHLKLDTGMHRLGFQEEDIDQLLSLLKRQSFIQIASVFSHLASSEDKNDDAYSKDQIASFEASSNRIITALDTPIKRHILNSAGISRFKESQYDFVRLGIGMYGIDNNPEINSSLKKVHELDANIIQIKRLKKGDSVGYNRKTIVERDSTIAIINIGYADGLMRNLGNQNYAFHIDGNEAPILGSICMDLSIIDITDIQDVQEGDFVTIFGVDHPIEQMASSAGTIAYEILSRVSDRVQRKFIRE